MRPTALIVFALTVIGQSVVPAASAVRQPASIFRFQSDGFWLNLHHFLYVLGRAEAGFPDRQRRAVIDAPTDQARVLPSLSEDDRRVWTATVTAYSKGLSLKDTALDQELMAVTTAMQRRDDAEPATARIDPGLAALLEQAAPVYRKAWWPAHQQANRSEVRELEGLVAQHGPAIVSYITRVYQERWPADGFPVHVTAYTNWTGAYSTGDRLLVVSSVDPGTKGLLGLEIVFHEAMHQWDDAMLRRVRRLATNNATAPVSDLLTHALIFYTAGEAVRALAPGHVPYAEWYGFWQQRELGAFKTALDTSWKPYLQGQGTLDQALTALLKVPTG
ncbi:MAG: hypothetical protein IT359_19680 [Gemmatimonadaceae bacterium]|nr:hypothetical protein [Gemmatimonadaceae bacterium]